MPSVRGRSRTLSSPKPSRKGFANIPWRNPFRGDDKLASAKIAMKGLGLFVGFKMRF